MPPEPEAGRLPPALEKDQRRPPTTAPGLLRARTTEEARRAMTQGVEAMVRVDVTKSQKKACRLPLLPSRRWEEAGRPQQNQQLQDQSVTLSIR